MEALDRHLQWDSQRWSDAIVMDFGCGSGLLSLPLARRCRKLYAVEPSEGMLTTLKDRHHNQPHPRGVIEPVQIYLNDQTVGQLNGQRFDLIVSSMVCHHLPDLPSTITLLASLLAPNGCLVVFDLENDGNACWFHDEQAKIDSGVIADDGFDCQYMREVFCRTGLRVELCETDFFCTKTVLDKEGKEICVVFSVLVVVGRRNV